MIILGIDPGTTAVGYALLKKEGAVIRFVGAGLFRIASQTPAERLKELHEELKKLIAAEKPSVVSIERLFFSHNQKTALAVAEARGVILLTSALAGLRVVEYTPLEIKKAVTGDGTADKGRLKKMLLLEMPALSVLRARDDVFDAIAAALTFCYLKKFDTL